MFHLLRSAWEGLLHLFYPDVCIGCNTPLKGNEHVLCLSCALQLPETHFHHLQENDAFRIFTGRVWIEKGTSLAYFNNGGLLQVLIHQLKYSGNKNAGIYLGRLLGQRLIEAKWQPIDYVIPVPLHPKKEAQRGYNQSVFIAQGICEVTGWQLETKALTRIKNTDSQTQKSRNERVENMGGAFTVTTKNSLIDKHILLVDDVLTTGATLESCILALNKKDYTKISVATIGIAVS